MAVKEILDKRVIDLDMNAKTKDEVIRHLAGLLHEAGYVDNLEGYIKDVYLRESEGITGIGGHPPDKCFNGSMHLLGRECQYTSQERPCQHHFSIFSAQFFESLVFSCFLLKSLVF